MNDCTAASSSSWTPSEIAALHRRLPGLKRETVGHVRAKPGRYGIDMVREHAGIVTFRVEQTCLVEKGEESLGFVEHRVELIGLYDHLGRMELEIDLVEIGTAPSSEMTVDVVVLVMDRCLAGIGTEFHALLSAPGREALLQI